MKLNSGKKNYVTLLNLCLITKPLGNDGLSKEFYEAFWNELKDSLLKLFYNAKTYSEFSTLQRQAVIKLLEKKNREKRLIKIGDESHY